MIERARPGNPHQGDPGKPTVTFQLLYCFFVIEHGRRRILHFNVTRHPTSEWVVQQLREADVITLLKATGLKP